MNLKRSTNHPAQVLFIPSGAIGDALMMIVLAQELHELNKDCAVTVIARRNAALIEDLARAYPFIRVVRIGKDVRGALVLLYESMRKPYTVLMPAVFAPGRIRSLKNLFRLLRFRPGSYTAGLVRADEQVPYNASVRYDHSLIHFDNMRNMAVAASLLVRSIGSPVPVLEVVEPVQNNSLLKAPHLVIHPFGSSSWKSWPPARTRDLIKLLSARYTEHEIVITGGPENAERAEALVNGFPHVRAMAGLPILEVAALMRSTSLYIGVDTGITHLACLLQVPSVLLEHNASPEWSPLYNPHAIVLTNLEHCACKGRKNGNCRVDVEGEPYHRCLYEVRDDSIMAAAEQLIARPNASMDAHGKGA